MGSEPREIPTGHLDDEDNNPFLSIGALLGGDWKPHTKKRVPPPVLASAVRSCGIYTWDRFGEVRLADPADEAKALNALASQHKWEEDPLSRQGDDPRSPVEIWGDDPEVSFSVFGWAKEVVPDELVPYLDGVRQDQNIQQRWQDFTKSEIAIKRKLAKWGATVALTAGDLAQKEAKLVELRKELADLKLKHEAAKIRGEAADAQMSKLEGHLNHDQGMQNRANQIAAEEMKTTGRKITRDRVARILAKELEMGEGTVLRRIRKGW